MKPDAPQAAPQHGAHQHGPAHGHHHGAAHTHHAPAHLRHHSDPKQREIRFDPLPPGQADRARVLLSGLENLEVVPSATANAVGVRYELIHYTFEGLESALSAQGFHLDNSLYCKILRAVVYFCEDTQLRNMRSPERLIKKSNEVYVKAWDHHPHGDHDDTPPELREYK